MIIGIAGKAGSGKSYVGKYILKKFSKYNAEVVPFAKRLKEIACDLGWDGKKDKKGRRLLQLLGTQVARDCISSDIWIRHIDSYIKKSVLDIVIIDDVRFDNEASYIKENKGIIIHLSGREEYKTLWQKIKNLFYTHVTEKGISSKYIDFYVDNSSPIKGNKKIKNIIRSIKNKLNKMNKGY